jgi:hypothetical protein
MLAINLNRTLVLNNTGWHYDKRVYSDYFLPISRNCVNPNSLVEKSILITDSTDGLVKKIDNPITKMYSVAASSNIHIPDEFLSSLKTFHQDPLAWWSGHALAYVLRFTPQFQDEIDKTAALIKFTDTCIGYT